MNLAPHFTLEELTRSAEAARFEIDNTLPPELLPALTNTAIGLERVRAVLGTLMYVGSGYRAPGVNCMVGGSMGIRSLRALLASENEAVRTIAEARIHMGRVDRYDSQHMAAQAADFTAPDAGTPLQVCEKIVWNRDIVVFDQLIWEHDWVHVSFVMPGSVPRGSVLTLQPGRKYSQGLVP